MEKEELQNKEGHNLEDENSELNNKKQASEETEKKEEVLFEKMFERNQFRLIHLTKQLNERPKAILTVYLNSKLTNSVIIYVTSLKNSLGGRFYKWKDGQQLKYLLEHLIDHQVIY